MDSQFLRRGSTVIDRKQNVPMRVVGQDRRTAVEHPNIDVNDPMLRQLGVEPEDAVYECVFLPTGEDSLSTPSKPYAYPEGRLARVPVEAAISEDARRVHTQIVLDVLAALLEVRWKATPNDIDPSIPLPEAVAEAIIGADIDAEVPTEVLLEEAQELADVAQTIGGADA